MSLIICTWTSKGGVGKTTVSVALAESAALGAPTVLVDCDPQGSSLRWSQLAAGAGQPLRSTVVPMPAADLPQRMATIARGYAAVVIDAPPPGPGVLQIAGGAVAVSDLVLAPVPPELAALDRMPAVARLAADHGKPVLAVLTMVRTGLAEHQAARDTLATWGIPVAATELRLGVEIQRAYGMPVTGTLARFGLDLLTELLDLTQEVTTDA